MLELFGLMRATGQLQLSRKLARYDALFNITTAIPARRGDYRLRNARLMISRIRR